MIIEVIDKLIDRLVQLVERRDSQRKELYSSIVAPALVEFEALHRHYKETFLAYRTLLRADGEPLDLRHPVLERLAEDSMASAEIRSRILALEPYESDPVVGRFTYRMCRYFLGLGAAPEVLARGYPRVPNAPRSAFQAGLKEIFGQPIPDESKRTRALALADHILGDLQVGYQLVMDEHVRLKASLLGLEPPGKPLSPVDAINLRLEDQRLRRQMLRRMQAPPE